MLVFEKCLALLFSLMILGQAYCVRRVVGTWLFPACLFGLFWFGNTFVGLALLFWVPADPFAIAFIFLCTLAFSIGSLPFDWKTAFERNAKKRSTAALVYGSTFLKVAFYVFVLVSLIFLVLNSYAQGISVHDLIFDLQASAASYTAMRYSGSVNINIFGQLNIISAYLSAILGGLLFPCLRSKTERRLVVVLSFISAILATVTQSNKGILFLCIAFFYGGMWVCRASASNLRLFEKGSIKSLMLCGAVLVAIVTVSFLSRGMYQIADNGFVLERLVSNFASYSFGHIFAFSDWFGFIIGRHSELVYPREGFTYGFYTFMAVFRALGNNRVVPDGYFDDYYTYGDLLRTNIFTMFRGLILDFGFIGSVLFMLVTGFLLHWIFRAMLTRTRPVFSVAAFVLMIGYFYTSFLISLLIWNSFYVVFVLLWMVLQANKLMVPTAHRRFAPSGRPSVALPCPRS
jgi:oligosaccharide repeat unit polymerase